MRAFTAPPVQIGIGRIGRIGIDETLTDPAGRHNARIDHGKCLRRCQRHTTQNRRDRRKGGDDGFQCAECSYRPAPSNKARRNKSCNTPKPLETERKSAATAMRSCIAVHFCHTRHDTQPD